MPFQGQWADSLFALERVYLLRIILWAIASVLVGSALTAWIRVRRVDSLLLHHFAMQALAWGLILLLLALWATASLAMRDLAAATALDRRTWFTVGLGIGCLAAGATLAGIGWRGGRRAALMGAGMGIVVQGAALVVLHLQLAAALVR